MRRTVWALLLCLLAVSAGLVWYPYLSAERVSTPFEAAELLQQAGEEPVRFRSSEVDPDTVYRALEARWPYAFALHATVRANKTTDLRVEVSRPGRQAQAKAYATALAADCITEDMTAEQKLRALHDALVRMCEYDVDTEQQEQPDGSTAPFSADGALLDHRGRVRRLRPRLRHAVRCGRHPGGLRCLRADEPRLECRASGRQDLVRRLHV